MLNNLLFKAISVYNSGFENSNIMGQEEFVKGLFEGFQYQFFDH